MIVPILDDGRLVVERQWRYPIGEAMLEFPAGNIREKSGLLTHASLLSAKSDGDMIAIRGNWLRKTFLCEELAPPPDLADQIGELLVGLTRTEIVNQRNTLTQCKGCHAAIDPIGMGFAQFDATGRFDSTIDLSAIMVAPALQTEGKNLQRAQGIGMAR